MFTSALVLAAVCAGGMAWGQGEKAADDAPKTAESKPKAGSAVDEDDDEEIIDDEPDEADESDDDEDDDEDDDDSELQLSYGGKIQSDLRFRLQDKSVGDWYDRRELPQGIDRNENLLGLRLGATYGDISAKAEIDFVLYGFSQGIEAVDDLSLREKVDPYRFEAHSLYVQVKDIPFDGLDLRVGQQLVLWGVGDQFNPTNNLNADDVEDPLLFGEQQGNFMVKLDYWIDEDWSISGVLVPVFKPALVPRSGQLAIAKTDRLPMVEEELRWRLHSEAAAALENPLGMRHATVVTEAVPVLPEKSFENMQVGYRIAGDLGGQDVALSYYYGRHDFPVPFKNHTTQDMTRRCNPDNPSDCIDSTLQTHTYLHYPRMHAYGFNMAGEVGWLEKISKKWFNAVGYRIEAALIVPEQSTIELSQDTLNVGIEVPGGEYDYNGDADGIGPRPVVVPDTPFAKWVVGLDYTFNEHVYLNLQWVHGLADEYGAGDWITEGYAVRSGGVMDTKNVALDCAFARDGRKCAREMLKPRIADYLVMGVDFKFMQSKGLFRLFTLFDLTGVDESYYDATTDQRVTDHHSMFSSEGFSAVIFPELGYNFGNGLELAAGALIQIGKEHSKFGDPAAGGSLAWARTRYSF